MPSTGKKPIDAEPDDHEFDEPAVEMTGPLDDGMIQNIGPPSRQRDGGGAHCLRRN